MTNISGRDSHRSRAASWRKLTHEYLHKEYALNLLIVDYTQEPNEVEPQAMGTLEALSMKRTGHENPSE